MWILIVTFMQIAVDPVLSPAPGCYPAFNRAYKTKASCLEAQNKLPEAIPGFSRTSHCHFVGLPK